MAALLASAIEEHLDSESPRQKTRRDSKLQLVEKQNKPSKSDRRPHMICTSTPARVTNQFNLYLLNQYRRTCANTFVSPILSLASLPTEPPPPYDTILPVYAEVANDSPPDYTSTTACAVRHDLHKLEHHLLAQPTEPSAAPPWHKQRHVQSLHHVHIDLNRTDYVRTRPGKAAKKAAKQAQQAKWADSGDEGDGNKDAGDGTGNDGGYGGNGNGNGNSNGAGGGAGGDGGGDGGGDDWAVGGGKKNKKKSKRQQKEEEEEKRKKEEEEENRKKEEDAAAAVTDSMWDDAGGDAADANKDSAGGTHPDDDWGFAGTGKKKKGKKGKDSVPTAPPAATTKGNDSSMDFADINLEDSAAPKIDLSFGASDSKKTGFELGGNDWGSSWASGGKSSGWGFGGLDDKDRKKKDEPLVADTGSFWGLGTSGKKDKEDEKAKDKKDAKKKDKGMNGAGFDFGFDAANAKDKDAADETKADVDTWAGFAPVSAKDKKKKDKKVSAFSALDDLAGDNPPPEAEVADISTEVWGTATSKKDKKGKKLAQEDPAPPPTSGSFMDDLDDGFGAFSAIGSKKDKDKDTDKDKKKAPTKKGAKDESLRDDKMTAKADPLAELEDETSGWGTWGTASKKDKKSNTTNTAFSAFNTGNDKDEEDDTWGGTDTWDTSATSKKDKKKGKAGIVGEPTPPPPPPVPDAPPENDLTSGFGTKKDRKAKKGAKDPEPEPPKKGKKDDIVKPDTVEPAKGDDDWDTGWGTGKRDKKKGTGKLLGTEIKPGETPPLAVLRPDPIPDNKPTEEDSFTGTWGSTKTAKAADKDKDKKKKKNEAFVVPPPVPTPPDQCLTPGSSQVEDDYDPLALDDWTTPATTSQSKDSKEKKKDEKKDAKKDPKKTMLSTADKKNKVAEAKADKKGKKTPLDDLSNGLDDLDLDEKAEENQAEEKKAEEKKAIEEKPAKAAKSFWGSAFGSSDSKTKTAKEKEKEKKEKEKEEAEAAEKARKEEEDFEAILADEDAKLDKVGNKKESKDSKASKEAKDSKDGKKFGSTFSGSTLTSKKDARTDNKKSDKSKNEITDLDALLEDDFGMPTSTKDSKKDKDGGDAWSFWGASNKKEADGGKEKGKEKEKEKPGGSKGKEIGNEKLTNQKPTKTEKAQASSEAAATDVDFIKTTRTTAKALLSTSKTTAPPKDSVADRIKKLQEKDKPAAPEPPPIPPLPPTADSKPSKDKPSITRKPPPTSAKLKKKDLDPPPVPSPVPGGFPGDDDFDGWNDVGSSAMPSDLKGKDKKNSKTLTTDKGKDKDKKSTSKVTATPLDLLDDFDNDLPEPEPTKKEKVKDLSDSKKSSSSKKQPEPVKPPTPPSEPEIRKEAASRKDRPRVKRDSGSWGFWGANKDESEVEPDKKERKSKTDREAPPSTTKNRSAASGLSRSKSSRTTNERDVEKGSRSSSDEAVKKEKPAKPSRGMSFSSFLGSGANPPPARSASKRQSMSGSRPSSSRRHSQDGRTGLPSPPPEEELSGKAANMLGLGRSASKKSKKTPTGGKDPYSLADEDLIMADAPPIASQPPDPKAAAKAKSKAKRLSEAGIDPILGEPYTPPERPAIKRSSSSAKKSEGLKSMFGSFRGGKKDKDVSARNRATDEEDNAAKRLRRESRRVHRSKDDTLGADANMTATQAEDAEARRAERRARRGDREKSPKEAPASPPPLAADDRTARRKEKERALRHKEKEEHLAASDRRFSRREKDKADEDDIAADNDRRRRRHDRQSVDLGKDTTLPPSSRPRIDKDSRRRSSYQPEERHRDREKEERRARRASGMPTSMEPSSKEKESKSSRRKSMQPDEYLPPKAKPSVSRKGTDKTASWVESVNAEPPLPPPVEPTVVEPMPDLRGGPKWSKSGGSKAPKMSKYRQEREREKEREKCGSRGGSAEDVDDDDGMGLEEDIGVPKKGAAAAGGGGWFKKFAGF